MTRSRIYKVTVSAHEKVLLAFYRAMPLQQQRDVEGLLASGWRIPNVAERFRAEGAELEIGLLQVSHIEPFLESSHDIIGVARRAA